MRNEKSVKNFNFIDRDAFLLYCPTYESYLDSFSTSRDTFYMPTLRSRRQLVKLGYRSNAVVYSRDEFKRKKEAIVTFMFGRTYKELEPLSSGLVIEDPVLKQLALRERANIEKNISTIIHLQDSKSKFHIYGYIDFEDSLRKFNLAAFGAVNWSKIFAGYSILRPKTSDLSYYNSHTGAVHYNSSDNYNILHSIEDGLTFVHRGDHKEIRVNSSTNCTREIFLSDVYGFVVIYDHIVRRKI